MRSASVVIGPLASLSLFAACVSVDSATFATHPPRPDDAEVRVYRAQQPSCSFDEIGLVTWSPRHDFESLEEGVTGMKQRAREMGGDAIVDFAYVRRETGVSTTISSDSTGAEATSTVQTQTTASGTVVRFREPGCV